MDPKQITEQIQSFLNTCSGLEMQRDYVGISQLGQCARKIYFDFVYGIQADDQAHSMAYAGYLFERDVIGRLEKMKIYRHDSLRELIAPWDMRFKGHIDGETTWGDLLEVKSASVLKFQRIAATQAAPREHYVQVQIYMHYGGYKHAWIVYVCRETLQHVVLRVDYSPNMAVQLEERGKLILATIDRREPPVCECGRCRRTNGKPPR